MNKLLTNVGICNYCEEFELLVNVVFTDEDGNGGFDIHTSCQNCLDHISEVRDYRYREVKAEEFNNAIMVSFLGFNEIDSLAEDCILEKEFIGVIKKAKGLRMSDDEFIVDIEKFKPVARELLGMGSIVVDPLKEGMCQSFLNQWVEY